jgi:hypothetical protein
MVRDSLKETGAAPERLELEITENVLIGNIQEALGTLKQLRELGVRLVMNDFGTGYSSLSYLQKFTFDKFKVDRSLISELAFDGSKRAIVRAMVDLGHGLGMETCAEGVETEEQLRLPAEEGCTKVQDFCSCGRGTATSCRTFARERRAGMARLQARLPSIVCRRWQLPDPARLARRHHHAASLPSSTAWQATSRPRRCLSAGTSMWQRSLARGQRGWNGQPEGGLSGDGSSPLSLMRWPRREGSAIGLEARSARV